MQLNEIQLLLDPVVSGLGYVLWGLEWTTDGRGILRLYIDHADGIKIEDCEKVSKQVSAVLDVNDSISTSYRLEVSSPGLDRSLYKPDQFLQFIGSTIALKLRTPIAGRAKFKGVLQESTEDLIRLKVDKEEMLIISHREIRAAKLVPIFDQGGLSEQTIIESC